MAEYTPGKDRIGFLSPFHLSFDESDDEERCGHNQTAVQQKPLKGCLIFVDVRAENENRSKAISRELERLGATIAEKITENVSHVVFKDGRKSTLTQLKKYPGIHFVSVLWVDSCKTTLSRVTESLFPAKLPNAVDSPLPIARPKRVKSLQPKTFEEDVNNSGKKEERKRRRLRKLNRDMDTPHDHIICLDSQEYIRSSDLYKLVATPRAVPDTPWILNYINGLENDESPSQLGSSMINKNSDMESLSEDVQCKLNFEAEKESGEQTHSYVIPVGSSPTELKKNSPPLSLKPTKVSFAKRTSICRRRSSRLSLSPLKKKKDEDKIIADEHIDNHSCEQKYLDIDDHNECNKNLNISNSSTSNVTLEHEIPMAEIDSTEVTKMVTMNSTWVPKKKKRLMSKTKFNVPQEKLISPVVKTEPKKSGKTQKENVSVQNNKRIPKTAGQLCDAYMAIHAVQNSKKSIHISVAKHHRDGVEDEENYTSSSSIHHSDNTERTKIKFTSEMNNTKNSVNVLPILSFSKQNKSQEVVSRVDVTTPFQPHQFSGCNTLEQNPFTSLTDNINGAKKSDNIIGKFQFNGKQKDNVVHSSRVEDVRQSGRLSLSRRSSGVDFKVLKSYRKAASTSVFEEKSTTYPVLGKSPPKVNEDVSVNTPCQVGLDEADSIDGNVSFVHDENEGLICLSQQTVEDDDSDEENSESLLTLDHVENNQAMIHAGVDTMNDDSGISDSEEIEKTCNDQSSMDISAMDVASQETIKTSTSCDAESKVKHKDGKRKEKQAAPKNKCKKKVTKQMLNRTAADRTLVSKTAKPKFSIVTTSLHYSEQEYTKAMVKQLGGFLLRTNVSHDTSHVIAGEKRRTLNVLHGIIKGCWIVSPKWIADSAEKGEWLDEEDYEMREEFPIARVARIVRLRDGKCKHSSLFERLEPIYLADVTSPSHEDMMKFIMSCGGKLTTSIRKAGLGVGLISCRRKDLRIVTEKWVLDSITNGRLMPLESYRVKLKNRDTSPDY